MVYVPAVVHARSLAHGLQSQTFCNPDLSYLAKDRHRILMYKLK